MTCLINLALFIWVVFLSTISKSVVHSLLQYPTLVKMCAVTSVCSDLVDTPAPAHRVPLQWNLILIFVMQVKKTKQSHPEWFFALVLSLLLHLVLHSWMTSSGVLGCSRVILWNVLILLCILCMPGFCSCSHWTTCLHASCMSMHEWWNVLHWWRWSA